MKKIGVISIERLIRYLEENKGATVKIKNSFHYIVEYEEGYQVAYSEKEGGKEIKINIKYQIKELIDIVLSMNENYELGFWLENEELWIDLKTKCFKNYEIAMLVARANNQKAIYDWKNKKSIYLED